MTVCRRDRRRTWPFAALLAAAIAVTACGDWAAAADSPVGRVIANIVPVHNRAHPAETHPAMDCAMDVLLDLEDAAQSRGDAADGA